MPRRPAANSRALQDQGRRAAGATERANRLYDSLRNLIVRGQLAPGARIVETEVAERFGVSRTPVRAAFQRLEREGYVVASATHQARMTVTPLTREDVGELLEIVGELEGLAARGAASLRSTPSFDVLPRPKVRSRASCTSSTRDSIAVMSRPAPARDSSRFMKP